MATHKQIAVLKILDLATLDRVIGGCRLVSITPAAPSLGADYDYGAMLLASPTGFGLDQVGSLDRIFAELELEPAKPAAYEAPAPASEAASSADLQADQVEQEQPALHATLVQGVQAQAVEAEAADAAPANGIHCGTMGIANEPRVVNAHVVSANRSR